MTDRNSLRILLERHRGADAREESDRLRMLDYAARLARPFSREQEGAHFTASAIVMDKAGERVCLVHHRKLNRWLQPGGHFEDSDGGDAVRAALREVQEETACVAKAMAGAPVPFDVDIHEIPPHGADSAHLHLDLRILVRAAGSHIAHNAAESHGARWLSWTAAIDQSDDASLRRVLLKAQAFVVGVSV